MPDPRPLSSVRSAATYDSPPASRSQSSTTIRARLRRSVEARRERPNRREAMVPHVPNSMPDTDAPRSLLAPSTGRRRRSNSPNEEEDARSTRATAADTTRFHRFKRQRTDSSPPARPRKPIKYGHYGQVESGRLVMELVSCDGGEHQDPRHPNTYLGPRNLLRHDKSVYCSENSAINVVLRHADETPFALEMLYILGPADGFTAPVRDGQVYVGMTMRDVEKYIDPPPHARRSVHHQPEGESDSAPSSPEELSLTEALRDPEVHAMLQERRERLRASRPDLNEYAFPWEQPDLDVYCDIPSPGTTTPPHPHSDLDDDTTNRPRPSILISEDEPGPEDASPQEVLDYRLQRLHLARRRADMPLHAAVLGAQNRSREQTHYGPLPVYRRPGARLQAPQSPPAALPHSRSTTPGSSTTVQPYHPTAASAEESALEDPNVTFTRFHIKKGNSRVGLQFDPPVSGRFVLLKLWANAGNVDVQSAVFFGWGGGRFFPAVALR